MAAALQGVAVPGNSAAAAAAAAGPAVSVTAVVVEQR